MITVLLRHLFVVGSISQKVKVSNQFQHRNSLALVHATATDPFFTVPAAYLTLKANRLLDSLIQKEIWEATRSASAGAVAGPPKWSRFVPRFTWLVVAA